MSEPPFHAYYRPKEGRWRGEYRFLVPSYSALFRGGLGLFAKLSFALTALLCRLLGPLRIDTSVDASELASGRVFHTTRLSKWGIPLQSSEEWFEVGPDGRSFAVTGSLRMPPAWWPQRYEASHGRVDETGERAEYVFAWPGVRIAQRTRPDEAALDVAQELDGCRATFVLRKES